MQLADTCQKGQVLRAPLPHSAWHHLGVGSFPLFCGLSALLMAKLKGKED